MLVIVVYTILNNQLDASNIKHKTRSLGIMFVKLVSIRLEERKITGWADCKCQGPWLLPVLADAGMADVVRISESRLIGESIEMRDMASIQVYEETSA